MPHPLSTGLDAAGCAGTTLKRNLTCMRAARPVKPASPSIPRPTRPPGPPGQSRPGRPGPPGRPGRPYAGRRGPGGRLRRLAPLTLTTLLAGTLAANPLAPADAAPAAAGAGTTVVSTEVVVDTGPAATARGDVHSPRAQYGWPTGSPAQVLRGFDPPAVAWAAGHRGVDLALAAGSPVLAAADGTVAFVGTVAGRPVVSIDHTDGVRTTYEPVEASVSAGDVVFRGQMIGTLLPGHRSDCVDALHWGARIGKKEYIDPLRLLKSAVVRLKPLNGTG